MKNALFCLGIVLMVGCKKTSNSDASPPPSLTRNEVDRDAYATYAAYVNAAKDGKEIGGDEIPPAYWIGEIKRLNPLKVYTHRVNIVVVQRVKEGVEEGRYINIPVSSYVPQSGDDGFVVTPDSKLNGVYDFKRTLQPAR